MTSFFNTTGFVNKIKPSALFITGIAARHTPYSLQKNLNEFILQHVFQEQIDDGDLDCLINKTIHIYIIDIKHRIALTLESKKLQMVEIPGTSSTANATISGNLSSFIQLATRSQDPDTLFFQRKLSIEGDTELGLTIKNIMDSIDFDNLPTWINKTIQGIKKIEHAAYNI